MALASVSASASATHLLAICLLLLALHSPHSALCYVLLAQGLGSRLSAFGFQLRLAKVINLSLWFLFGFA